MKILTNISIKKIGGITQTLSSFVNFLDSSKKTQTDVVGVDLLSGQKSEPRRDTNGGRFSLISQNVEMPNIGDAIKNSANIADIERQYDGAIAAFEENIKREGPDVILINGTYFIPWCFLKASRNFNIPTILHYHGSITKETEHWKTETHKGLFREMETQFDNPNLFYIFPSNLTKKTVETEIFGHAVNKFSILPNPVPDHFFGAKPKGKRKKIGVLGRWTGVKNPNFIRRLARYNAKKGGEYSLHIVSDLNNDSRVKQELSGLATFKKPFDNKDLPNYYASLGVVVSPSHFETYGNVPKEALASGVPALVSERMGVAETFRELGLGDWVVDLRSVKETYSKIREVSGQSVPDGVRDSIRERYGSAPIHSRMLNIIRSV